MMNALVSTLRKLYPSESANGNGASSMTLTSAGPHIRDAFNHSLAMRRMIVALAPCILWGLYNTGLQANLNMALLGITSAPGWRGGIMDMLGLGYKPASILSAIVHGALYYLPVFVVVLVVGDFWERVFATVRGRPRTEGIVALALLFSLILPPTIPLWQAGLGMTFGVVIGKEIFGGTGKGMLNPALTGFAFLYVTYPKEMVMESTWAVADAFTKATYLSFAQQQRPEVLDWIGSSWEVAFLGFTPGGFGTTSVVAVLLGAVFLLSTRTVSGRIILGVLAGMVVTAIAFNKLGDSSFASLTWNWHLVLGSFAFGTVFLATDPSTAAMTDKGRWIYGLLVGALIILFRVANSHHPDGVMFAVLLGNIFAPLIDYLVMQADIRRRARRHD